MRKYVKKSKLSIFKVLELIGKPIFFLFKAIVLIWFFTFEIINRLIQKIRLPSFKLPQIPKFALPKLKLKVPKIKHPHFRYSIFLFLILISSIVFSIYYFIFKDLPSVKLLTDSPPSLSTKIYDRHGVLLYQIYKDENRSLIKLSDLPPIVIAATLAAEDKNFYHHYGIDFTGLARATWNNFVNCKLKIVNCNVQGGSTITQQLVKNTLLTPEKTFTRKLKELVLSFEAEHTYSKDQILEMYLNQINYGGTAYGIEEASHEYFGKSARDLNLAESSMLAGLPIAPTTLSPFGTNPYLGKIRQQQVLESMVASKSISEDDKVKALSTSLVFHPQGKFIKAPHFVMYVKDLLVKQFGEDKVARGGLEVTTTLDLSIEETLQHEIDTELAKLKNLHVENGAGLVVNPKTGEILAMVGSHDFFDTDHDGQVNITLQERQPGSSIKPITYALALSRGLNPSSVIDDTPICFKSKGSPDYCPRNYDSTFHGQVTLRTALASSYNIPATKLLNAYGITNMIGLARTLGITTWEDPSRFGLSLTLGAGEVKMVDLASVYATFANQGIKVPLNSIISVKDPQGLDLQEKIDPVGVQALSPIIAYQITSILSDPLARAPAFGMNSILNLPGKNVAVKTGTTNSLRDNWTFGYTPNLLVATWVGNNDNTPMSAVASGITGASPIWARTMKSLLTDNPAPPFDPPIGLVKARISCDYPDKFEYFIEGNAPKIDCSQKIGTLLDSAASTSR